MTARRALVTGITGQDGSYLAELLLSEGYEVAGVVRRPLEQPLGDIEPLRERLTLLSGDLSDPATLDAALERVRPHELYHLAAPTFVPDSWEDPAQTLTLVTQATAALLTSVRRIDPSMRVYVATSGQIFGDAGVSPQNESTPCRPTHPYGVAKLAVHLLVGTMRAHHGLFACSGITYNHESPRRPERFVTRKVTRAAAAIKLGRERELVLGDLDAVRDWSFAGDIVRGAWLSLQQAEPDDYVLASGIARTVGDVARAAFACVGLDADDHIRRDPTLVRGPESTAPVGDPTRARERLGWSAGVSFEEMIAAMVAADLERLNEG